MHSIDTSELTFGLGVEFPLGPLAVFGDLVGSVQWVDVDLTVDKQEVSYEAINFGLGARAGIRAELRSWFFVMVAGEMGFIGGVRWNAALSAGFRFG